MCVIYNASKYAHSAHHHSRQHTAFRRFGHDRAVSRVCVWCTVLLWCRTIASYHAILVACCSYKDDIYALLKPPNRLRYVTRTHIHTRATEKKNRFICCYCLQFNVARLREFVLEHRDPHSCATTVSRQYVHIPAAECLFSPPHFPAAATRRAMSN